MPAKFKAVNVVLGIAFLCYIMTDIMTVTGDRGTWNQFVNGFLHVYFKIRSVFWF